MKYLTHYMDEPQSALLRECGAFFAFDKKQLEAGKKRVGNMNSADYVNMHGGLICLRAKTKELKDGLERIYRDAIKQDMADHTVEAIILRELGNHECWYTGDITDAVKKLEDYGITEEQIETLFAKHWPDN